MRTLFGIAVSIAAVLAPLAAHAAFEGPGSPFPPDVAAQSRVITGPTFANVMSREGPAGVVMGATFSSTITIGGTSYTAPSGLNATVIARLNGSAELLWSRVFVSPVTEARIHAVTSDADANIYFFATGELVDYGCGVVAGQGAFVSLNKNGACRFSQPVIVPGAFSVSVFSLDLDPNGGFIATGFSYPGFTWTNGPTLTGNGFITRLRPNGTHDWTRTILSDGGFNAHTGIDPAGHVIITCNFFRNLTIAGATMHRGGLDRGACLGRIGLAHGELESMTLIDGVETILPPRVNPDGTYALMGTFSANNVTIGGKVLANDFGLNVISQFVARMAPDDTAIFAEEIHGTSSHDAAAVDITPEGDVLALVQASSFDSSKDSVEIDEVELHVQGIVYVLAKIDGQSGDLVDLVYLNGFVDSDSFVHTPRIESLAISRNGHLFLAGSPLGVADAHNSFTATDLVRLRF